MHPGEPIMGRLALLVMSMAVGMSIVCGGGIEFMRPWTE